MEKEPLASSLEPGTLDTATTQNPEHNNKEETLEEARKHHAERVKKYTEKKDKLEHLIDVFENCRRLISPTPHQAPPRTPQLTPEEEQRLWKEHLAYKQREQARERREGEERQRQEAEQKRREAESPQRQDLISRFAYRGDACFMSDPGQDEDSKRMRRLGMDPLWYYIQFGERYEKKKRFLKPLKAVRRGAIPAVFVGLGWWVTGKLFGYHGS